MKYANSFWAPLIFTLHLFNKKLKKILMYIQLSHKPKFRLQKMQMLLSLWQDKTLMKILNRNDISGTLSQMLNWN